MRLYMYVQMSVDLPVLIAAYVLLQRSVPRPRLPVYHDYVRHITVSRPHLFRAVCHMELSEAKALATRLGVDIYKCGSWKMSDWDRLVIFLVSTAQGTTLRFLESHLHLSKSAIRDNSHLFCDRIIHVLNHATSGTYR